MLAILAILAILAMLILATLPIKVLSKLLLLLKVAKTAKEIGLNARARARVLELCFPQMAKEIGLNARARARVLELCFPQPQFSAFKAALIGSQAAPRARLALLSRPVTQGKPQDIIPKIPKRLMTLISS